MSKSTTIPTESTFGLVLSKQFAGKQVLENPVCIYHYIWDFEKNTGIANLVSINGTPVNVVLYTMGISGYLDFMSDIKPTKFLVNAEPGNSIALVEVVLYRVILDINRTTGARSGAIMFNVDGSSIQTTSNFQDSASRLSASEAVTA